MRCWNTQLQASGFALVLGAFLLSIFSAVKSNLSCAHQESPPVWPRQALPSECAWKCHFSKKNTHTHSVLQGKAWRSGSVLKRHILQVFKWIFLSFYLLGGVRVSSWWVGISRGSRNIFPIFPIFPLLWEKQHIHIETPFFLCPKLWFSFVL